MVIIILFLYLKISTHQLLHASRHVLAFSECLLVPFPSPLKNIVHNVICGSVREGLGDLTVCSVT